jgi:hypothetical protein
MFNYIERGFVMKYVTFFTLICLCVSTSSHATIINVPADQPSIQAGINAAVNGDTVLVADSTYYENINFKGKAITVASHFLIDNDSTHVDSTIIDGSQPTNPDSGSVVYFISGEDTTSILFGFTISAGTGTYLPPGPPPLAPFSLRAGGGICCWLSSPLITNNKIKNNNCVIDIVDAQAIGGGIFSLDERLNYSIIIKDNEILNNYTHADGNTGGLDNCWALGGGIAVFSNGLIQGNTILSNTCKSINKYSIGGGIRTSLSMNLEILENKIKHNHSVSINSRAFAGGISCSGANVIISHNDISNNTVSSSILSRGAGIFFDQVGGHTATVNNNFISNNYASLGVCDGGAIGFTRSQFLDIYNNIITDNSARNGGALNGRDNSNPIIINNTIINNTADQSGGAIFIEDSNSKIIVLNTILWNNIALGTGNEIDSAFGATTSINYSNVQGGFIGIGNINADPMFADTIHYELSDASPCIGAGIDSIEIGGIWYTIPTTCYLGHPRPNPAGSNPDIGACESPLAVSGLEQSLDNISRSFHLSQNYPNPFNPSTTIEIDLPKTSRVSLKVFNILGEEVATLVSDRLSAGSYSYDWDASNLASGVYLYRLQAGEYIETRKMVLMR